MITASIDKAQACLSDFLGDPCIECHMMSIGCPYATGCSDCLLAQNSEGVLP